MAKKSPRRYSNEFKQETVDLVLKQGYSVADAARAVGITPALLYKWKAKLTEQPILNDDEKAELLRLRKEIKQLRMEQEILKKASVESTGQRNTLFQYLLWGFKVKCFSRSFI
jgi:transposase